MLTRLFVSGFKNLVDVNVRFGPFTCIAGTNGIGKSNLFDAISFLSYLAVHPLQEAALMVRDEEAKSGDLRSLFTRTGKEYASQMVFEADLIIPAQGTDDLGQQAKASFTFLRYKVVLGYEESSGMSSIGRLVILEEELYYIKKGDAIKNLGFEHRPEWRNSVITGRRTIAYISTILKNDNRDEGTRIQRHQEKAGQPLKYSASSLTRTVLSASNAAEASTALLAKKEMQSWRLLQLEPGALRQPDRFISASGLASNGLHLPATLYRLARQNGENAEVALYAQISNRLAQLNEDVRRVGIDRDDKRELLTLEVEDRSGTRHSARALSDGTLRFLALAVIEQDQELSGVLCLEEPENGIHPARIPAMLQLLQDIATDTTRAIGEDNSLRQVIINTHSPAVVMLVPEDCLVIADRVRLPTNDGKIASRVFFGALPGTWRTQTQPDPYPKFDPAQPVPIGKLLDYLNPVSSNDLREEEESYNGRKTTKQKRLVDRPDLGQLSLFSANNISNNHVA